VIERPASVVKELLENAIDAGAETIEIEFVRGGIDRIEVRDDGHGIHPDDLPDAVKRHATSKIETTDDLNRVGTLGFRGEALASIASVAELRLLSKVDEEDEAFEYRADGDNGGEIRPAARKTGTTVTVNSLFEDVPARRKFLKTERTERKHLIRECQRKVLAHPDIHFRVKEGEETLFSVPPGDLRDRVEETMGRDLSESLIEVDRLEGSWREIGRMGLSGLIGDGEVTSRNRRKQFYFVNGRPVREPMLFRAVTQAYEDLVISDEHPPVFLFLDMPRDELDVNVHPRKEEIRIHQSQDVFRFVHRTVRDTIKEYFQESADSTVSTDFGTGVPSAREKERAERVLDGSSDDDRRERSEGTDEESSDGPETTERPDLFSGDPSEQPEQSSEEPQREARVLGQFRETFLVVERDTGLMLVDQHTAHERILYEQYREEIQGEEPAQYLSVPLTLELDRSETEILLDRSDELESLGLTIESFGGGSLVVHTVPSYLGRRAEDKRAVYGMIEEFLDWSRDDRVSDPGEDLVTIMACRSAVMRGDRLMPKEMDELIRGWVELDFPGKCPHGRNIFKEIGNSEIAGWFQRPEDDVCAN
jgi:DNA mismatch repair protein MutL